VQQIITVSTIVRGLRRLDLKLGNNILVHCALSKIGWVQGGAQAVIEALIEVVGGEGTITMPTLTNGRFDPSEWRNPPVAKQYWGQIRAEMPLYHKRKTPTDASMSAVYELFRTWPAALRTGHPHSSMVSWGKAKHQITHQHKLEDRFGESSPLARLYELDARVLFLGTGYDTNTCFHLAEYRQQQPPLREYMLVTEKSGKRVLEKYIDVDSNSSVFADLGADFEKQAHPKRVDIGQAMCRVFSLRHAVDFAQEWLSTARGD